MSEALRAIVLAYDGSAAARGAAQLAFRIAGACEADVLATHVLETAWGTPSHAEAMADFERTLAEETSSWERQLAALEALAPERTPFRLSVTRGEVAAKLLETLEAEHASLAVAGTHGVGGIRPLLGSVSHQLVEHAPCPVLLVREQQVEGPPTILAAIDGSAASLAGLELAQALAAGFGATLRLVHVLDPHIPFSPQQSPAALDLMRGHARQMLHDARATVQAPLDDVVEDLREGDPRAELIKACQEHAPAIIVTASRGVGGFRGLLLGSTARELVNHAPCPVLVTRAATVGEEGVPAARA